VFVRRWSLRSKVMALLAVVAGAASFTLVRGYAAELEALRPTAGDTVQVVVADRQSSAMGRAPRARRARKATRLARKRFPAAAAK
jgi:hypothetical protein